ncbi:DUF5324 family protein [Kitasatospora sp. A2-31]|uniref:DUF5324 family protein n=1 Tax=Kitasatospora sp. A2-31 TaxID=2916414 RepID=UPI001EEC7BBF|nr:DUF5324 family protein [Kitasatospora sp. A2-31]MCG6494671.1 DUF5324 family protein [Kitasatospora sp. A2-31]
MTRLDTARETAGRTRDTLAPYAVTAKETAVHFADGARQRLGPTVEALGPKAAHAAQSARVQYDKHIAPQLGHAFASLPPDAQQNVLKTLHRAQEAALAAKLNAARATEQARSTVGPRIAQAVDDARSAVVPVAQEAQTRGAAAVAALQGHVTAAEINELAAKNARREHRSAWATGLAVAGAVAIGSGIVAWQWWRHHSNPEWLVEPPAETSAPPRPTGAHATGPGGPGDAGGSVNGSPAGSAPETAGEETAGGEAAPGPEAGTTAPKPGPPPGKPAPDDDRPKPHDPRKPH